MLRQLSSNFSSLNLKRAKVKKELNLVCLEKEVERVILIKDLVLQNLMHDTRLIETHHPQVSKLSISTVYNPF
jgi:hypothetical protein